MAERELAIRISHVSKRYRLGQIGGATLQKDLQSWWAVKRGKEDPNMPIDATGRTRGDRFLALDDINLTVYEGETLGIIGRNGAGKSTLLKLLSRVTAPTEGEIDIYGTLSSMLEVGTGFHPEMTGRENVYLNGAILGMTRAEVDEKMDDIIEFSEIGEFIDTPVKRYSSGMYVKLAFSVAAHLDSDIMIMDEVLAVGDMAFQKKCLSAMRTAAKRDGRTVLYVSHNMNTIRQLCDRCIVIDEGRIVYDGRTDEAIRLYLDNRSGDELRLDYADVRRPDWLKFPLIDLHSAEYLGAGTCRFERGEPIRIRLSWTNFADLPSTSLRVELRSTDDVPQATYVLLDFYQGAEGESATLDLELETDHLAESTYYMTYTFFQHDEFGNQENMECRRGLTFELVKGEGDEPLIWDSFNWGYVELEGIHIAALTKS